MSADNDDILQDFLVEAGELFDDLGEQLVELEQRPQDKELLNAIFRAFHTIKGGAGFLKLTAMVETCHAAEDVFNLLRQGERSVNAELIDIFLQVLDVLGDMFNQIRSGDELVAAAPALIEKIEKLARPDTDVQPAPVTDSTADAATMDDEFEAMLDAAKNDTDTVQTTSTSDSSIITDDEFEDLLNQLHGNGKHGSLAEAAPVQQPAESEAGNSPASDLITDDEFEAVLDELQAKKNAEGASQAETVQAVVSSSESSTVPSAVSEARPAKRKDAIHTETSVRVDTARLDDIMNLVGELVLVRNRLSTLKLDMKQDEVAEAIASLELVTSDLQTSVMKTRMQPIKKVFNRFPRVIRDLARQLNKEVELELLGEDTDLDKNLVEALADPLIHLVRNAVDHGIETPQKRFESGKSRTGKVVLSALQEGDRILLSVSDDGKGMDAKVLRRLAVEKGVMDEAAASRLTDIEAFNLIFAPGFSTKTEVSDVSGRGVGMDVVKTRITELNGIIEINSVRDVGTTITIRLPLTLAIMPTLMVMLNKYQFALPLANVHEAINLDQDEIYMVDGQEMLMVRDKPLPLFYLHKWLMNGIYDGPEEGHKVIVVQMASQRFCLVVDELIGQEEVVIKPLSMMLRNTAGFTGATITGDGGIALIFDLPGMMGAYASGY